MTASDRPEDNNDAPKDSPPIAGNTPQRSTRAPAEGADEQREGDKPYDHATADRGQAPLERDARDPAEGRPDAGDGS